MKIRERRYLYFKKLNRSSKSLGVKLYDELFTYGVAGTRVFIDDAGKVMVNPLTYDDCMDLLELERNGFTIPDNITIKTLD